MKFLSDIEVEEGLKDDSGDLGTAGQVLSSTGTATNWIDASGTIGGSIADNQIAVGAATANTIEGSNNFSLIPLTLGAVTSARFRVNGRLEISDNLSQGASNVYIGVGAGGDSASGGNVGVGQSALGDQTSAANQGESNCALGLSALADLTLGNNNVAIGTASLNYLTGTGQNDNTAIGNEAARFYSTGTDLLTQSSQGVYIGSDTRASANNISNEIAIGYGVVGGGSDTITLGNSSVDLLRIPGLNATNNQVLTYNATAGGFKAAAGGGGGGIGGSITAGQVAFGATTADEITGSSALTFTSSNTLEIDNSGSTGSTPNLVLNKGSFGTSKILMQNAGVTKLDINCSSSDDSFISASGSLTLSAASATNPHIIMASASTAKVGIGNTFPGEKLDVTGRIKASAGVQVGNETSTTAIAGLVGTIRYYTATIGSFDYSYVDMCMQTDTATYEWVNILTNRWAN